MHAMWRIDMHKIAWSHYVLDGSIKNEPGRDLVEQTNKNAVDFENHSHLAYMLGSAI